jgi:hypothetical protein
LIAQRPRILGLVAALAFLTAFAATAASEESIGLDGTWQLVHKENFEQYLKESGAPWWKRRLAQLGSSSMQQTIEQVGRRFEIANESLLETRAETFVADGVTEQSGKMASGDLMTWKAHVEDAALVLDGHGDLGHRIIRREIVDAAMVMTVLNPDADTQCRLTFERAEPD